MSTLDSVRRLGLGPVRSWLGRLRGTPAVWGSVSRDIGILWLVFGTGVLAYGATREAALAAVESLALRVLADRIEHGEMAPGRLELTVPATA